MWEARLDSASARRLDVNDLYWLTDEQLARLEPYFRKSHGRPAGKRSTGVERDHLRQSLWPALAGRAEGLRPPQDAV